VKKYLDERRRSTREYFLENQHGHDDAAGILYY
jgi:hypothetical protein